MVTLYTRDLLTTEPTASELIQGTKEIGDVMLQVLCLTVG